MTDPIGGSFKFETKNLNNDIVTIRSTRNVLVKNETAGNKGFQQVSICGGKSTIINSGNKEPQATLNIKNSAGRDIFSYITSLDDDIKSLSDADFSKLNEKDLQSKFGNNVKVEKDPYTMKATITYSYIAGNYEKQGATLTIDFESEIEKAEREKKEAETKAKKEQERLANAKKKEEESEKAKKLGDHYRNLKEDPMYRLVDFICNLFGRPYKP